MTRHITMLVGWSLGVMATVAAQAPDGQALYRQHCRSCHGLRGVPARNMLTVYPTLKSLADSAFRTTHSAEQIVGVLRQGSGRDMKSFKDKLTPEEMLAVAKFVLTLGAATAAAP